MPKVIAVAKPTKAAATTIQYAIGQIGNPQHARDSDQPKHHEGPHAQQHPVGHHEQHQQRYKLRVNVDRQQRRTDEIRRGRCKVRYSGSTALSEK